MKLESIQARRLDIPFNMAFRHASAERSTTQTLWVEARSSDGVTGFGEACPREYVTAETLEGAEQFVASHAREWLAGIHDVASLKRWVEQNERGIDAHPAAWAAVELSLLDLLGKCEGRPVEAVLHLPALSGRFTFTAVIGDADPGTFEKQLAHYLKAGFRQFKIKLSGTAERDAGKARALAAAGIAPSAVRADANNLWSDAGTAVSFLRALDFPFFALEEPLGAADYAGMRDVAAALGTRIILDESLLRVEQLERLEGSVESWIANIRISKQGGMLRSLRLAGRAREMGVRVIVGAHVGETSVLTRAALTVANAYRDILFAQEGAFGTHLLARDVARPALMFGAGGILDAATLAENAAGFGLNIELADASGGVVAHEPS